MIPAKSYSREGAFYKDRIIINLNNKTMTIQEPHYKVNITF